MTAEELQSEFEIQLRASGALAFRVALAVLRQREDAEDVAQEALLKAYRSYRSLRDPARFRAWLVRLTWRLAIDRQREDRRRLLRESSAVNEAAGVPAIAPAAPGDGHAEIWAAIDALPDRLRFALVLANIEGHTVREVADLLRVPEGTVKSRLFAARKTLAERLQWKHRATR